MRKNWPAIAGWENRRRPQDKECRQPLETRRDKEIDLPLEPTERNVALPTPWLWPSETCYSSNLQDCKIRNLCPFKPLVVICYISLRKLICISSTVHSQSFSRFPLPVHTLGVIQGFHPLLICSSYTLSLAPIDKELYSPLKANRKEVWELDWTFSSIPTSTFN